MSSLVESLTTHFQGRLQSCTTSVQGEVTIEIESSDLISICTALRDEPEFLFKQLIDLCGVDYLTYGDTEWCTELATESGFSRGRKNKKDSRHTWSKARFAVVYHLISYEHNQRLRVRAFVTEEEPTISSVIDVWNSANWYEREAFDLYGIIFQGHPDLRRILTDYGFIGHPFRKDFPLSGHVEMRYDEDKKRVVYEPVKIEPRVLVPRVIRDDQRFTSGQEEEG